MDWRAFDLSVNQACHYQSGRTIPLHSWWQHFDSAPMMASAFTLYRCTPRYDLKRPSIPRIQHCPVKSQNGNCNMLAWWCIYTLLPLQERPMKYITIHDHKFTYRDQELWEIKTLKVISENTDLTLRNQEIVEIETHEKILSQGHKIYHFISHFYVRYCIGH
jgi:hypothetical protein